MGTQLDRLSDKVASATSKSLERRTTRQGFLVRMGLVGSALVVAPLRYLIRPGSAWAYVTSCSSCTSGLCFTSHTSAFCCTLDGGTNDCPSGTSPCGWWRCCDPTYCGTGYKYFLDCCGCTNIAGHCAQDSCGDRKVCCYDKEWGQCTTSYTKIRCRIIRCVNPGTLFSNCTTTLATDTTCCQGSTASTCPGIVQNHPNCCDTCTAC
jgi:hypothetical protein